MTLMRRRTRTFLMVAIILAVVVGAVASPIALAALGRVIDLDWLLLGNIGQAYGAAAAVLSALALAAVAASVWYQARMIGLQSVQFARDHQREILHLLAEDPETYAPAHTPYIASLSATDVRRHIFNQLMMNYLQARYTSGSLNARDLEGFDGMRLFFGTAYGRRYWQGNRTGYLNSEEPKVQRFAQIVDREYRKAVASGPPEAPLSREIREDVASPQPRRHIAGRTLRDIAVGVAAGVVAGWVIGHHKR